MHNVFNLRLHVLLISCMASYSICAYIISKIFFFFFFGANCLKMVLGEASTRCGTWAVGFVHVSKIQDEEVMNRSQALPGF